MTETCADPVVLALNAERRHRFGQAKVEDNRRISTRKRKYLFANLLGKLNRWTFKR